MGGHVGGDVLRGTQATDDDGLVEIEMLYPGWYPGRTARSGAWVRHEALCTKIGSCHNIFDSATNRVMVPCAVPSPPIAFPA